MIVLVRYSLDNHPHFISLFVAETTQLRRTTKELEENLLRTEQRFSQLQKTLLSFEEGTIDDFLLNLINVFFFCIR
jgi:hypothetical protein